ncbi:hypothetical protein ACFWBH_30390 [Streptomyces sp. NPDC059999]|uniref:hypothetical protein n=1 Tax=Streptomyces sp. NPDC059999 TaxID=3347030 RepID=UPI003699E58E
MDAGLGGAAKHADVAGEPAQSDVTVLGDGFTVQQTESSVDVAVGEGTARAPEREDEFAAERAVLARLFDDLRVLRCGQERLDRGGRGTGGKSQAAYFGEPGFLVACGDGFEPAMERG